MSRARRIAVRRWGRRRSDVFCIIAVLGRAMTDRRAVRCMAAVLAVTIMPPGERALGQTYPTRLVRLIVPFPPGGSADTVGRLVSQKLSDEFAVQVIVDNRPGAATLIGSEQVAKAAPDGYTLLLGSAALAINASLVEKLPFDPATGFSPITLVTSAPNLLTVNPTLPATSVQELIALAKARPHELNFGSAGVGTGNHLAGEMFKIMAGIDLVHVPYKGDAPSITDLLGGQIQILFVGTAPVKSHIISGRLRALAITSRTRSTVFPDLPTMIETGLTEYESSTWAGLFAPRNTPKPIVEKLNASVRKLLSQADVNDKLTTLGYDAVGNRAEEFSEYFASEIAKWGRVVREAKLRVE
jgi:tripartite-type tricarboxylate transporter receptor subunit TctC